MKLLNTLTLAAIMTVLSFSSSCNRERIDGPEIVGRQNPMNGTQETPAVSTTATGTVTTEYNKRTKLLTYTVTWSGLSGPVAAMHIHGVADPGSPAGVVQNIITSSGGLATPGSRYGTSGSFTGSLLVDEVKFKEAELLAGKFYMNIHTAQFPNGEIRGQMFF